MSTPLPGSKISLVGSDPGTCGCLVRSAGDEGLYLLTAGHVLLRTTSEVGDVVLNVSESGTVPVASLSRWVDPGTGGAGASRVDAAIARMIDSSCASSRIPGIGSPTGRTDLLAIGDRVRMVGGSSAFQVGHVVDLDYSADLRVDLPGRAGVAVTYRSLVLCTRFTASGDSGAAILNDRREVVGIHMGGTDSASFFCRIGEVCSQLRVEIVT